jgi:hypothetical protein
VARALGHEGAWRSARSKLKKKAIGWFMALGRIALLNPDLHEEIRAGARDLYREQIEEEHPIIRVLENVEESIKSGQPLDPEYDLDMRNDNGQWSVRESETETA